MTRQHFFTVSVFLVFVLVFSGIMFAQRVIDLDKLWGDMRVLGKAAGDWSGNAVAYGDINGDGFMDIIIGAKMADPLEAGETYVIFGSGSPSSTLDLSTESADITVCGAAAYDNCGCAVACDDVNNDGYDDLIIGASGAAPGDPPRTDAGKIYVIFGSGFPSPPYTIDLSTYQADITIYGNGSYDRCGSAVASGNVNGDTYKDLIIAAHCANPGGRSEAGEAYVIFGSGFPSPPYTIDLSTTLADITICGDDDFDYFGYGLASGDVNNDSYTDVIIGAKDADPLGRDLAGETYVILGSDFSSPPYTIDLDTELADITIYGANAGDVSGLAVASGDVNGDGLDDIIIGAGSADPGGRSQAGETYVIFGFSPSGPCIIDLSVSSADITICGANAGDFCGSWVALGHVNGDDYEDLIISAGAASPGGRLAAGETYVIFGSSLSSPPYTIDLSTDSTDITVCGDDAEDVSGCKVVGGDVNGDGYDDLLIGAAWADPGGRDKAGETYLIAGGGAFITAHGLGGKSWIKEFNLLANGLNSFKAFGTVNSQGEIHLAVGDMDADSLDEIAAGQGEGAKSWVKFFEVNGSLISTFKAFGAANTNGELHLALGNFDSETSDTEIAIAQGEGGQSWVKLFETDGTFIRSIKAFGATNTQGEVHLAAGDLENADGIDEIVAGMGEGGSSWVKIFSHEGTKIRSFQAFSSTENPGGEVHLAVGNFDADADMEIAVATGYDGGNIVKLFEKNGTFIRGFSPFGMGGNPNGDVQIAAAEIVNDGVDEIICGHGEGGVSQVKVFKADGTVIRSFKAFGGVNTQGEVHLGKSNY